MRRFFSKGRGLGLLAVAAISLGAVSLQAQPPGAESVTVRGTVKSFTRAPMGEVDGILLTDGTVVHWPPHLADRFRNILSQGDKVKVVGWMDTGPKGDNKLEVSKLTNLTTDETRINDDATALRADPKGKGKGKDKGPKGPDPDAEFLTVKGTVRDFTKAPKGEVDGLMLTDGTWIHWPPHLSERFANAVDKSDKVKVQGFMEKGPQGDSKLEVSSLTNLRTSKTVENPDRPAPATSRLTTGRAGDPADRLRELEERLDQLQKEINRLRKSK